MNRLLMAMMAALVLVGCGQTGPLYMPDNQQARDRYDPQGDYGPQGNQEQEGAQQDNAQPNDAQQNDAQQNNAPQNNAPQNDNAEGQSAVSVPEGDSSPETTTAGQVGGAASTGAPAAPAAAGQGGT
ncbi:lipoprotein-attachment site-containing protein [Kushneria avicenniae]|uniref:Lipoprotein-attachment site-containing protein n=1 Tax=Kushneria avicenniae TaxID=402385 RepID=A0A1I1J740_9GAMM|nr:lipoprotein-attachment site-containing protein [Kushneria avicenniae]